MTSKSEVVRPLSGVHLDPGMIDAARSECEDIITHRRRTGVWAITGGSATLPPGENCARLIDSVKKGVTRQEYGRGLYITRHGHDIPDLHPPCIAIPLQTRGLPSSLKGPDNRTITVDWELGKAWEILQVIRLTPVYEEGGILLLLYLRNQPS